MTNETHPGISPFHPAGRGETRPDRGRGWIGAKSHLAVALLCAFLLLLAGCADKANPDNIDRRAVERWDYLIAHQAEKAYDYLTPGTRTTLTRENYAATMNNRPLQWKAAKFNRKQCETDHCTVYVDITYSLKLPTVGRTTQATRTLEEKWILTGGQWYFLPDN